MQLSERNELAIVSTLNTVSTLWLDDYRVFEKAACYVCDSTLPSDSYN